MTNKITYKELYNALLELPEVKANKAWTDKLHDAIEALDKKSTAKSASKTQIMNEEIKATMLELMVEKSLYTCTQMLKMLNDDRVISQQKVSALFNALVDEGKVERVKDKKTTYFKKIQFINGECGKVPTAPPNRRKEVNNE